MLPRRCIRLLAGLLLLPALALAQEMPIFDAHIHYAHDAFEVVPASQLIGLMRKAGVRRALVSGAMAPGSIDDGAQKLYALAPELIVPSLRPYRKREDVPTWYRDPEVLAELEARLKKYRYAAIGEFHLYGANADTEPSFAEWCNWRGSTISCCMHIPIAMPSSV